MTAAPYLCHYRRPSGQWRQPSAWGAGEGRRTVRSGGEHAAPFPHAVQAGGKVGGMGKGCAGDGEGVRWPDDAEPPTRAKGA